MAETAVCPECKAEIEGGPFRLGLHRRQRHGIVGKTAGRRARKADRAPRGSGKAKTPSLEADLRRVFKTLGTVVAVADPYCGTVLVKSSGDFCAALARLAKDDPRIAKWLRSLGKVGPYGALIVAAGELVLPIAAHHGLVPGELALLVGATPPPPRSRVPESEPHIEGMGTAAGPHIEGMGTAAGPHIEGMGTAAGWGDGEGSLERA